jgi:hypothetical protein
MFWPIWALSCVNILIVCKLLCSFGLFLVICLRWAVVPVTVTDCYKIMLAAIIQNAAFPATESECQPCALFERKIISFKF